jgi:serine protease Do
MTRMAPFALFVALIAGIVPSPAADPPIKAFEEQMHKLIEDVTPSIVAVVVSHAKYPDDGVKKKPGQLGTYDPPAIHEEIRHRWFQRRPELNRLDLSLAENTADHLFGSGVVVDAKQGLILTPYHLIEGATKIYVRTSTGKGVYADIRAADAKSDLAVLKLISVPDGLRSVTMAEVRLVKSTKGEEPTIKKGSFIVAVGHPLAGGVTDGSPSASWGVVSNIGRGSAPAPVALDPTSQTLKPLHAYGGLIQVDARVTLGSSGSAVFDLDGRLVGLGSTVAAVYGSEANGGFAIPMDSKYRRIVDVLKQGREVEYGFLGVAPESTDRGVNITQVTPGCPAELAGLMSQDLLTSIDGHPLRSTEDVHLHVGGSLAGTEVIVEFQRRTSATPQTKSAKVILAKNKNPLPFIASVSPPAPFGLTVEYQSVNLMSSRLGAGRFGAPVFTANPPVGVIIRDDKPIPGSIADKRFAELGAAKGYWVITHVDGNPVKTPAEFHEATRNKSTFKLFVASSDDPTDRRTVTLP